MYTSHPSQLRSRSKWSCCRSVLRLRGLLFRGGEESGSPGASGVANGLQKWNAPAIPLFAGVNAIVIQATDLAGNTCWRSLIVTRTGS